MKICHDCGFSVEIKDLNCPQCQIPLLVDSKAEILDNIITYHQIIKNTHAESHLLKNLSRVKHWYYWPEKKLFAPSKFIGFKKMNEKRYGTGKGFGGNDSQRWIQLMGWSKEVKKGTQNYFDLLDQLEDFLGQFAKTPNKAHCIHIL